MAAEAVDPERASITWSTAARLARSDRRAQGICRVEDSTPTGRRASWVSSSTSSTESSGKSRQSWNDRTTPEGRPLLGQVLDQALAVEPDRAGLGV